MKTGAIIPVLLAVDSAYPPLYDEEIGVIQRKE